MEYINFVIRGSRETLLERSEEIYKLHRIIATILRKEDWYFVDKNQVDLDAKDSFVKTILSGLKKKIKSHTIIREIPDNFIDNISSSSSFFGSKKYDNGLIVSYVIGINDSSDSEIVIKNWRKEFEERSTDLIEFISEASKYLEIIEIHFPDESVASYVKNFFPHPNYVIIYDEM